jgi:hypothetical protein
MQEYNKQPTPMELATLAARMGDTSTAGIQRAYVAYYNAGGVLMTADMVKDLSPAMYPEYVACLERGDDLTVAIGNAASETFPSKEKALKMLTIADPRTISSILKWASKNKLISKDEYDQITQAFDDATGTNRITHGIIKKLVDLKRQKKSMEGRQNRLSASKPRRKRKPVK